MPNRSFRDTTRSEKINSVSAGAEVFFYRLMMKADDYGNYYGTPKLLRADLYPLKDSVKESDVLKWVNECTATGMIVRYSVGGKDYLHIRDFGQRMRFGAKNKFPKYETTDNQTPPLPAESGGELPPKEQTQVKDQIEDKVKGKKEQAASLALPFESKEFIEKWEVLLRQKKWKGKSEDALRENLEFLSKQTEQDAIGMMKKTIAGNWAGLFELTDKDRKDANGGLPDYWDRELFYKLQSQDPKKWQQYIQRLKDLGFVAKYNTTDSPSKGQLMGYYKTQAA